MKKTLTLCLALILAMAMLIPAFAEGTLNVALTNPYTGSSAINTANPYRYATLSQVYETLLCAKDGQYYGVLASEWENTAPGVWAVTLKEGIIDSEGNHFTASDVAFVLNAQKDAGFDEGKYYDADAVEVVDDTHFVINMNTDSEGAFYLLATKMFMVTEKAYNDSPDQMATKPVGTGPYTAEIVEGSSATLTKRADYWDQGELAPAQIANYDTINISYLPEATQMSITIDGKQVQFAGQVDMSISGEVDAVDSVTASYVSNGTYNGLGYNMYGRDISTNKALREAVAYAIDPVGLEMSVYSGHATTMDFYGMSTAIDWNEAWISPYHYDPDMAKEKLAEAGYENGVTLVLLANNVGEDSKIAELIQGYLAMVGITVQFDYVEPATQSARRAEGNWDICLAGGMGVADMYIFWNNFYAKETTGMSKYFHNGDELYSIWDAYAAIGGKTEEGRQTLYEYEVNNLTWLPMFNKQVLYVTDNNYEGMLYNELYMSLPYLGTLQAK